MSPRAQSPSKRGPAIDRVAVLCLGAATAVLQVLAVREGIAASAGNETIVAVLFGAWLLSTALGAALGRKSRASRAAVAFALAGYGLLVPATVLAARAACRLVAPGSSPSLLLTTGAALLLLGPSCALAGWLYARLARGDLSEAADAQGDLSARAYWLETLGAGCSGVLLSVLLLDRLLPAHVVALGAAVAFVGAASLARGPVRMFVAALGFVACAALSLLPVDRVSHAWQLPGHDVLEVQSSSRGTLLRTEQRGQLQIVMQRTPLLVPSDHHAGELFGLLPSALHPNPSVVAFVGVPPGDALVQVLRHPLVRVDVIVGDERVAEMVRKYAPGGSDPRVHVSAEDERQWARNAQQGSHDLVVVYTGAPLAVASGRLFSAECYQSLRGRLREGGVVVVALPGYGARPSAEQRRLYCSVAASMRTAFAHVLALPADAMLLIGSDATTLQRPQIAHTVSSRLAARGIVPSVVHATWADSTLADDRIGDAAQWVSLPEVPSTDIRPTVVYAALRATMSELDEVGLRLPWLLGGLVLIALLVWANPWSRPTSFAIATTGMAGLALQLVLMLVYQTAVAALYRDVALVTAAFMLSSCVATWWASRASASHARVLLCDIVQAAVAVTVALALPALVVSHGVAARLAACAAAALVGASTGAQVALVSRLPGAFAGGVGGALYAVDLLGAALAATLAYTVMVPACGLTGTAWIVAAAKGVSAMALALRRSPRQATAAARPMPLPVVAWMALVAIMLDPLLSRFLRAWTLHRNYTLGVLLVLAGALLAAFSPDSVRAWSVSWQRRLRGVTHRIGISPRRLVAFSVLLPLASLPVARCYFLVPFLFCHTCPRPCTFGVVRPYLVTTALLANVGDRRFCEHTCPLGHVQNAAWGAGLARWRAGRIVWGVRLLVLLLVAVGYVQVRADHQGGATGVGWFAALYVHDYAVSAGVLVAAGLLLSLSFLVRRPFCEGACPIGAVSDLIGKAEKRWICGRRTHDAGNDR